MTVTQDLVMAAYLGLFFSAIPSLFMAMEYGYSFKRWTKTFGFLFISLTLWSFALITFVPRFR